jgi:lipopolysaccharide/colanic/teichoic acid biosynthesis glycosyltransferase
MARTTLRSRTAPRAREKLYKRPFDLAVIVLAHLLLLPVWILLWGLIPLLIWLEDRGPVFYPQKRVGKEGRVFTILKFRTLVQNADKMVQAWTVPDQRYVTRIGRILRSTALDELPQVLNILTGDMSFVGPRAMPLNEFQEFQDKIPGLEQRLAVRPGLTGMAQVYGEGVRDAREKLRYDLDYVQRMSLLLDVKLMLLSVRNTVLARWDTEGPNPAPPA